MKNNSYANTSLLVMLAAAILVSGFFVASSALAAILDVPGTYSTIQAAVDAAVDGDTINVAAGTYNESVSIEKKLSLIGAVGTKPVITGLAPATYIIKVNGVNDVVISNLEINGEGTARGANTFNYGILVNNSGTITNPVELKNLTVKNIWNTSSNGVEVDADTMGGSNALIHDSAISAFDKRGIRFIKSSGKVYDNEVIGQNVDGISRVQNLINLWGGSSVEIYGNKLHNALTTGATPTWDSVGVLVTSYDNNIDSHADIHDNEIYISDSGIIVGSVYADTDASSADITNNDLHDLNWAINFEKETASAVIHGNKFSNNNKAINTEGDGPIIMNSEISATNNYWGAASGPANGAISENVNYRPWLLEVGGTTYDQTIALTEASQWALVSAPKLLSEAPAVVSDDNGSVTLLGYENGEFVTPSDNEKPISAFFAKPTNKGGVGFKYAVSGLSQTSKELSAGWNLVGTNNPGIDRNEFSTILDTPTVAGMVTLFVPDTYNSRKDSDYYVSWGSDANQDIAISNLPGNNLSAYDGYWVFMNAVKSFVKNL